MALQLLFNGALMLFFVYCYFYVGSIAPEPEPGTIDGAQWPQMLIILLVFFLAVNMYKIYKKTPKEERNFNPISGVNFANICKNKLFIGIVILFIYAFALEYLGFILSSFLLCLTYSRLLGEKRVSQLFLYSFLSVAILYFLFSKGLNIMLPRGVGLLRDFALMLESI
ncbi:tripartite tricarboxylate transporter TctB family protein [Lutispora sp.]|uniref:tripartite tricarboxylate transporter TctB family protein n=1 Tax=Lutispora sp. TaxID=2828727 RepID=UPI002B1FFFC0|nr:tripartite tricarboxylate transporter TctB family protein [Lutispora sp.]MEA4960749.1 tripartite tricarboxylate transporter TctB family protein [Lutispora sp.]